MEHYTIESFIDEKSGLKVSETSVFTNGDIVLLFERNNGHILLLDLMYIKELENKKISDALLRKLKSRGFIHGKDKESCILKCDILPEFFMIDLTNQCNMRCKYCLRNVGMPNESMTKTVLLDICNYINSYCEKEHLSDVSIQPWGGEPLLELDSILQMRKHIHPKDTRVHFTIETNGTLLNQNIIDQLYYHKIGIGISIDGFSKAHDSQRLLISGCGTHKIVENNLLLAKNRYGDKLGTITTITRYNAPFIEEILEYFACYLKLTAIKINFVHNSIFSDCENLCLSDEEIAITETRILRKIVELNERGYPISEHNIKVKLKNLLFKQYSDICNSKGCQGGRKMIVFDRGGNIYPCELTDTPNENIGSIYDGRDLISMIYRAVKTRDYFNDKKAEICFNCEWYIFCQGGCTVRTISYGKRPSEIDTVECAVNRTLYPALAELIITKPNVINSLLSCQVL